MGTRQNHIERGSQSRDPNWTPEIRPRCRSKKLEQWCGAGKECFSMQHFFPDGCLNKFWLWFHVLLFSILDGWWSTVTHSVEWLERAKFNSILRNLEACVSTTWLLGCWFYRNTHLGLAQNLGKGLLRLGTLILSFAQFMSGQFWPCFQWAMRWFGANHFKPF